MQYNILIKTSHTYLIEGLELETGHQIVTAVETHRLRQQQRTVLTLGRRWAKPPAGRVGSYPDLAQMGVHAFDVTNVLMRGRLNELNEAL